MASNYHIRNILAPRQSEDDFAHQAFSRQNRTTHQGSKSKERGRSHPGELGDDVERSVRAVERAVENFGALKENCQYYKDMAEDFRRGLEAEKAERKEADGFLDNLEHEVRVERDRASRAEERAAAAEMTIRDLEYELEAVRTQTERLVETISQLALAESEARGDHDEAYRQAA